MFIYIYAGGRLSEPPVQIDVYTGSVLIQTASENMSTLIVYSHESTL